MINNTYVNIYAGFVFNQKAIHVKIEINKV